MAILDLEVLRVEALLHRSASRLQARPAVLSPGSGASLHQPSRGAAPGRARGCAATSSRSSAASRGTSLTLDGRLARRPRVVAHALLKRRGSSTAGLGHQLSVDEEVVGLDRDLLEHLAAQQLERAVDVANPDEEDPDEAVVDPRERSSAPGGVVAPDAEADDHSWAAISGRNPRVGEVELVVSVGVEDERFTRVARSRCGGRRRRPDCLVARARTRGSWRRRGSSARSRVRRAAVVDDQELELFDERRAGTSSARAITQAPMFSLLVVGGQHD